MKRATAVRVALAIILSLAAGPVLADVAGPTFSLRVGGVAGEPMLIDSSLSGANSPPGGFGTYGPNDVNAAGLATNPLTGAIYGVDGASSAFKVVRFDPSVEFEKGQTAVYGGIGQGNMWATGKGTWLGSVESSRAADGVAPPRQVMTFDPYMTTNGQSGGVAISASSGDTPHYQEFVVQKADLGLGVWDEGTTSSVTNTVALVTNVTAYPTVDFLGGLPGSGHWQGYEMDVLRGQFIPTNDDATALIATNSGGDGTISRYFMGTAGVGAVLIVHVDAKRSLEPTATAAGTREFYKRDNSNAGAVLLDATQAADLVPGIADTGRDLAQNPLTGDLYILSNTSTETYLSAIRPTISDDSDVAPTYEVVDLDLSDNGGLPGGVTYLTLTQFHGDLLAAGGITFTSDGSRLLISVYSSSAVTGEVPAIYALDVTNPVPEPATLGLLALGGLGMIGGAIRRRRAA